MAVKFLTQVGILWTIELVFQKKPDSFLPGTSFHWPNITPVFLFYVFLYIYFYVIPVSLEKSLENSLSLIHSLPGSSVPHGLCIIAEDTASQSKDNSLEF